MLHQKKNQITEIKAISKTGFKVTVKDHESHYFVKLYFYDDTGTYRQGVCTCHESLPCRHIIGSLLNMLYKKDTLSLDLKNSQTNRMLGDFESLLLHSTPTSMGQLLTLI